MAVNGKRGRIQGPTEFVISGVMLFNCLPPLAECYLCLREIPLAALTPVGALCVHISGPASRGSTKLLVLITQKGFLAWLRHVVPTRVSASIKEDERMPPSPPDANLW